MVCRSLKISVCSKPNPSLNLLMVTFYRYLTFDNPTHISLDECRFYHIFYSSSRNAITRITSDVFNTEAHPFKLPAPKASYGSNSAATQSRSPTPFEASDGPLPAISSTPAMPKPLKVGDFLKGKRRLRHH